MTVTFKVTCANRHQFEAVGTGAGSYGEFVMYGAAIKAGPAYLFALEDPVYREVSALIDELPETRGRSELQRADLLQEVFGVACDPAPDGSRYKIGFPPCPTCGTHKLDTWSVLDAYNGPVLPVTHQAWNAASKAQKTAWLKDALARTYPSS